MSSYYEILGVSKNASTEEIKASYRRLAKTHHPDKSGNKEQFQKIQEAYEHLSDVEKRNKYDNPMIPNGFPQQNFPFPFPQNFPFNRNNRQVKKNDEYYHFKISLHDVYFGVEKTFNIKKRYMCDNCKIICNNCNGTGHVTGQQINIGFIINFLQQICNNCHGNGMVKNNINCHHCSNQGFKFKEKVINLRIPKGIENDKEYIFEGWGEQAIKPEEISGNFIIKIQIEKDELFTRENLDLIYRQDINLFDSITGKEIKIPFYDEIIIIDTSKFGIINPSKEYIVIQKGLPNEKNERGNLKIKFTISYPNKTLKQDEINKLKLCFQEIEI